MYLMNWSDVLAAGAEVAGGKGWNLARLHRYGFPVPLGGVVVADGYRHFLQHPDLQADLRAIHAISADEIANPATAVALERLRAAIIHTPLPVEIEREVHAFLAQAGLADKPVAVRSSATAEDSAIASFAGIHHSFLHITGTAAILEALRACYASLWTLQAVAYRRRMKLPDHAVAAAVVILEMVPAVAAGVAFSCEPRTGRVDRFTISASFGLGDAVVSGAIEPDEYLVDTSRYPPVIAHRQIGRKGHKTIARAGGGVTQQQIDPHEGARAALTDEQIAALTLLVARVHDSLGEMHQPQDVEWAHDGERFWLLQARPVTNLPTPTLSYVADQPQIWSNANLKDVLPGVISPLGWSSIRGSFEMLLAGPLRAAGYTYVSGIAWVRLFAGRAYFNLSALQWAMYDALGVPPAEFNRVLGGHQPEIVVPPARLADKVRRALALIRTLARSLPMMWRASADFRRLWSLAEAKEQMNLAHVSKQELMEELRSIQAHVEAFLPRFNLINGAAGSTTQALFRLLEPVFGVRSIGLANAMLTGATGATSARQGEQLIELGNGAFDEPAVLAFFTDLDWRPETWAVRLAGTQFAARFAAYLRMYGHRGVYELEPMNPRWREDPTYLLETLRSQIRGGQKLPLPNQADKRQEALRTVRQQLGFSLRWLRVWIAMQQSIRFSALREMAKSVLVKVSGISRLCGLEIGRRLVAEGRLAQAEEIFFLSWSDVEAYLHNRPDIAGFQALVADRRALRERQLQMEPPDVMMGDTPVKTAPAPAAVGAVLTGMGVATGRATGAARIIRHPNEGARLQPGEVLVAPSTDPAWTPLFLRAAAIVMEVGGYLSHGAIVAREYGLPAVVNIPGLLQTVREGESLTVDGDAGKVYRT